MKKLHSHFLSFIIFCLTVSLTACGHSQQDEPTGDVEAALQELDRVVANRQEYVTQHEKLIDEARQQLQQATEDSTRLTVSRQLAELYFFFQADSARHYLEYCLRTAHRLGDDVTACELQCRKAVLYGLSGWPWEGISLLDTLRAETTSPPLLRQIYAGYFDVCDYYYAYRLPPAMLTRNRAYLNSLKDSLQKYERADRHRLIRVNEVEKSLEETVQYLKKEMGKAQNDNERGTLAIVISNKYQQMSDKHQRDLYWALSAAYFVKACRMDNEGLLRLAQLMYEEGNVERSALYATAAAEQADFYGSNSRKLELYDLVEKLRKSNEQSVDRQRIWLWATGIVSILLLMTCGVTLWVLIRRRRGAVVELTTASQTLADEQEKCRTLEVRSRACQEGLTHFLALSIDAIFEIGNFRHYVLRRLRAGESKQLLKQMTTELGCSAGQRNLIHSFDVAFTRLYPDFSREVNELLRPDDRIIVAEGELLNNELRVLALLRVGIASSQRIATILGISVHTVYFYRNRMKNRAISRDTFEADMMHIGE